MDFYEFFHTMQCNVRVLLRPSHIALFHLILWFNVRAQSPGSMSMFDVQERELKHWQANTPAQCPSSMY